MLKPVKQDIGTQLWCGPAALSATTGEKVSTITDTFLRVRPGNKHRSDIKSVTNWQMRQVAKILGFEMTQIHAFERRHFSVEEMTEKHPRYGFGMTKWRDDTSVPTLAAYLRKHRADFQTQAVIIEVNGHYLAAFGRRACDNNSVVPVFLTKIQMRRSRVRSVWQITRKAAVAASAGH